MFDPNKFNPPNTPDNAKEIVRQNVVKASQSILDLIDESRRGELALRIVATDKALKSEKEIFDLKEFRLRLMKDLFDEQGIVMPKDHWELPEMAAYKSAHRRLTGLILEWWGKEYPADAPLSFIKDPHIADTPEKPQDPNPRPFSKRNISRWNNHVGQGAKKFDE